MTIDNASIFEHAREVTREFFKSARQASALAESEMKDELAVWDPLQVAVEPLPDWARLLHADMPDWGREACAHRWLEGLEALSSMIVQERFWPVSAGRCGDLPGWVYAALDRLALGVENWLAGRADYLPEDTWISDLLGEQNPVVVSLLIKTKHWYRRMLNFASGGVQNGSLPAVLWDLPDIQQLRGGAGG